MKFKTIKTKKVKAKKPSTPVESKLERFKRFAETEQDPEILANLKWWINELENR